MMGGNGSMSFRKFPLSEAAISNDVPKERQFSLGEIGTRKAYNLDDSKRHLNLNEVWFVRCSKKDCQYRTDQGFLKDACTADAVYVSSDGKFYFIEFKAQPSGNIKKKEVWGKAVESLYVASLTLLGAHSMDYIRENAEFVLVAKVISPETENHSPKRVEDIRSDEAFRKFTTPVRGLGACLDGARNPIYFELDRLKKKRLYHDVHTFSEEQFLEWARDRLV